jgi:hypothetical protein
MKKLLKYLCPHTWFKKRKIVFYSKYPYGEYLNPIIKSSEFKREWVKKSIKKMKEDILKKDQRDVTFGHKCLGINALFNEGFIIKAHNEFAIETNGNEDDIKIHINGDIVDLENRHNMRRGMSIFPPFILGDYTAPFGAVKSVVKIDTPWFVEAPKDVVFLIMPVYYADDNRFSANVAIHDPMYALQVNVMFWWFIKNGYEVIRKGTPMAQLIPIPRKNVCESFKMVDFVPEKMYKKDEALHIVKTRSKCAMYSEYKDIAKKIYELP